MKDNRKLKWILDGKFPFGNEKGKKIIDGVEEPDYVCNVAKGTFFWKKKRIKKEENN